MSRILVVDDELSIREMLEIFLRKAGHLVDLASDGATGIQRLIDEDEYDLVITDLRMPGAQGMVLLERCRELRPDTPIIIMTAFATHQTAVEAIKMGAYSYFSKPFDLDQTQAVIESALQMRRKVLDMRELRREGRELRRELATQKGFRGLIGRSRAMEQVMDLVMRVARTRTNILILGKSGTGKELVARAIHDHSERSRGPFLVINCGAIPENLLESELFGHRRGAFTGAMADKDGLFKAAAGGSVFLDEVGELPTAMQVKLLRVLQERQVKPIGDVRETPIDVRVISATNRDLAAEVKAGRFREDLYYRLNVISIELPPLRDRPGDIPLLAYHFLSKFAAEQGKTIEEIEPEALMLLQRHTYQGNVRELENLLERAVALEESERITVSALPPHIRVSAAPPPIIEAGADLPENGVDLDKSVDALERRLISQALQRTGGQKTEASKLLNITFRSLRYRLQKLNLEVGPDDEE